MTVLEKILIALLALVIVIGGGLFMYEKFVNAKALQALSSQMTAQKQLVDNITRSQANYATKDDINTMAKDSGVNLDAIRKDLATLNASLTAINQVSIGSTGQVASNLGSTSVTPNVNPPNQTVAADPYGYTKNTQNLHLDEQFTDNTTVPIGDVSFNASVPKPWSVNLLPREYSAVTTIGTDEDGKISAYNNFTIAAGGKTYPIKIANSKLLQQFPTAHFTFMPRLFLGVDGGVNITAVQPEMTPNVSLGVIGYGKLRTQPDLSILQVGVGYGVVSKNFQIEVMPISYNIGSKIPLMSNLYVGPTVGMDIQGHFTVGAGLRVGL